MSPYRAWAPEFRPPAPRHTWWRHALCLLRGHDWFIYRENVAKAMALVHLHHMAGADAFCRRCGLTWLDAEPVIQGTDPEYRSTQAPGPAGTGQSEGKEKPEPTEEPGST